MRRSKLYRHQLGAVLPTEPDYGEVMSAEPEAKLHANGVNVDLPSHQDWTKSIGHSRRALAKSYGLSARLATKLESRTEFKVREPLHVGILTLGGMGGSGKVAREAGQALAEAGHDVTIISSPGGFWETTGNVTQVSDRLHIELSERVPKSPQVMNEADRRVLAKEIVDLVKKGNLDVLNVHYVGGGLLAAAIEAKEMLRDEGISIKVVGTLHGTDVTTMGTSSEEGPSIKQALLAADEITSVSHWLGGRAQSVFDLPYMPRVIENSVDVATFNPRQWSNLRERIAPNGEFVLCHVSNFRAVKRPLDVVDTFAKIRAAGVSAKLVLIGDGPMMKDVYERASAYGIALDIVAPGPQPPEQVAKFMAASDLALFTSDSESFCLAALEAISCGIPVVGSRCGGLDEILSNIELTPSLNANTLLLSRPGDTDRMAATCIGLLRNRHAYEVLQLRCAELPLDRYPQSRFAQGYLSLMEDMRPELGPPHPTSEAASDLEPTGPLSLSKSSIFALVTGREADFGALSELGALHQANQPERHRRTRRKLV